MTIKNSNKVQKFKVESDYYIGYGANLKKLRGVKKKIFTQWAVSRDHAVRLVEIKNPEIDSYSLSTGWISRAIRIN
jgi:hypothetical protein